MESKVHFTRAPKYAEAKRLAEKGIGGIFITKSALARMPKKTRKLLAKSGVSVSVESARGRPISIGAGKISEIVELHRDNRTYREIEQITGIPKSTCHYLVKYAERQKLKSGNRVVYL